MATKHVFVDYGNVKAGNFDFLAARQFKVMIFLGALAVGCYRKKREPVTGTWQAPLPQTIWKAIWENEMSIAS